MALSNGNTFTGDLIFLNARSQDKDGNKLTPHFEVAKRDKDKKIVKTDETYTKVSGDLLRPRFTQREYKGTMNKHLVLYIRDGNEVYSLDNTYRISTRSLFNALLSLKDPKGIAISIYESKKGYEALSLWQGDKLVPWKFDTRPEADQVPKAITVKFKGKDQHDFSPVDDFFEEELKKWADEVFGPEKEQKKSGENGTTAPDNSEASSPAQENLDEDVPF